MFLLILDHGIEDWDVKKGLDLAGWIRLLSKRKALDYLDKCDIYNKTSKNKQYNLEAIFQKPSNENVEKKAIARTILNKIPDGIEKVKPPRYKLVLKMFFYDEKSADEIAIILKTSKDNVFRIKSLALKKLKKIIGY